MNRLVRAWVAAAIAGVLLAACAGSPVTFPPEQKFDRSRGTPISATACGFQLLLFIPINVNNRQARAYRALTESAPYAYITDIKVQESWNYGFVGTQYCTTLEATAYPKR